MKKTLKNHISNIIELIMFLFVPYLFYAFVNSNFDTTEWGTPSKFFYGLYALIVLIVAFTNWNDK